MRSVDLVSREWCDLVFEGRNRSYGAYRLRKEAGRRYGRALLGTALVLLLVMAMAWGVNRFYAVRSDGELARLLEEMHRMESLHRQDSHLLRFIDSTPKVEEPVPQIVKVVPEIVEVPIEVEATPTLELERSSVVDTVVAAPLPADTLVAVPVEEVQPLLPLQPTEVVQEMPQFPGGPTALMRWLDRNVIYPPLVVQQNVSGITYLTFLVNQEGTISEAKVEEPLHPMISAAIMTAARKMPKWEPGRINGQVAIVRVTIPIEFHQR